MAESASPVTPSLVFVPNLRPERGMGHLKRCLSAAASAGQEAAVYIGSAGDEPGTAFDLSTVQVLADRAGAVLWHSWPPGPPIPTVVADLQITPPSAFRFLRNRADRLIGWDEGGPWRHRFPFLVDSLPHQTLPPPNLRLPGLLGLISPSDQPRFDRPIRRVLAVFGGGDPAGLTRRFLALVKTMQNRGIWPYDLSVVRGPFATQLAFDGVTWLDAPDNLAALVGQWDLVVTSWGLTALESLAAGASVLLLNPSPYHERLSQTAGLPTLGLLRPGVRRFQKGLALAAGAARQTRDRFVAPPIDAGVYFRQFHGTDGRCPVCRTPGHPVFARTEHKSYHRCETCGMEYLSVHQLPPKVYSEAYFFEEYQRQYGKTYLDDFSHIQNLGVQRLAFLGQTCDFPPGRRVFDVGCAYGPFLAAAAQAGHRPFGLDVAEGAVTHVTQRLGFPAVRASFLDFRWESSFPGEPRPDLLTLWYVIEHFSDLDRVLRQVQASLAVGGLFAFSTPNGRGITRTFQPEKFWKESPDDHFSVWSPVNTRPVLARYGFEVLAFRITGRHPERFPGLRGPSDLRWPLVVMLDRWFGWGDTFEVYARKIKELS